jgi:superfamily II DNA or RNA helicase
MALPSVGIVGGGKKIKGRRVMCYTAGSLHHAQGDEDFVFVDEGDQACSDVYAERMAMFDHARIWMFSATWDMRLDNKNMRAEAMAGPIRLRVSYREAEDNKMVLPVEVFLTDVITDVNPCTDFDGYEKKRAGIWAHEYRNSLIAADANRYDDDVQILITVDTVEHGLYLQRLLPNFAFVYAGKNLKSYQLKAFHEKGLIDDDWQIMTDERKAKLTRRFEKGYLKKAIATTVWNVGVNFKGLQVIIRADGSGSPANDTQVPGRAVRLHDDKQVAIVHDYLDQFDTGYHAKAEHRIKSYEANEWTVHRPDKSKKSRLRQLMLWGER